MKQKKSSLLHASHIPAGAFRVMMNLWPPFIGAGIHVVSIAPDFSEIRVRLRLGLFNRNAVGTHFGGSLFAMTDPFFMLMLGRELGSDYVVWDKAAAIRFRKPGRGTVSATFRIDADALAEIRARTADGDKFEPLFTVAVTDAAGEVVAEVDKQLYVRRARVG